MVCEEYDLGDEEVGFMEVENHVCPSEFAFWGRFISIQTQVPVMLKSPNCPHMRTLVHIVASEASADGSPHGSSYGDGVQAVLDSPVAGWKSEVKAVGQLHLLKPSVEASIFQVYGCKKVVWSLSAHMQLLRVS